MIWWLVHNLFEISDKKDYKKDYKRLQKNKTTKKTTKKTSTNWHHLVKIYLVPLGKVSTEWYWSVITE